MSSRERLILAIIVAILVLWSDQAFAQIAGGGGAGGGLLQTLIQWVITNIVQGLIAICVLVAGGLLMFGRHTLAALAVAAIGMLVIANYQTIAGFFPVGG